ncbi:uncharacterized protein LOC105421932 [Amborella trichopoda]|uniref:uncharacterized protein LOC105421932 n=1 Tax=Amborella trichopoda TaxID=13333 RepID=UPI0005D35D36|nr:uncharacterized protein LOC105421932 [Amborella trichopoda]|eukprot:XP_011629360.1 uncharacterized protein LOC105421932 [Amborella trichopoda]
MHDPSSMVTLKTCCYKLNIDGAALHNSGLAGGGRVIRNYNDGFVAPFAKDFGFVSNNFAEFQALEEGILLAIQKGCFPIQIEGDSSLLVDAIENQRRAPWRLQMIVDNCRARLSPHRWSIAHILHKANMVIDAITKR